MEAPHEHGAMDAIVSQVTAEVRQHVAAVLSEELDRDSKLAIKVRHSVHQALVQEKVLISSKADEDAHVRVVQQLQRKLGLLNAKYEGLRHENRMQRRSLDALAPILRLEDSSPIEMQGDTKPKVVSYQTYESAVEQNRVLREQLREYMEQCKSEATARTLLIAKCRWAKNAIKEWREFHQNWQSWRAKRDNVSTRSRLQTPLSELDRQYRELPVLEDLDVTLHRDADKLGVAKLLRGYDASGTYTPPAVSKQNTTVEDHQMDSTADNIDRAIQPKEHGAIAVNSAVEELCTVNEPHISRIAQPMASSAPPPERHADLTLDTRQTKLRRTVLQAQAEDDILFVKERSLKRKRGEKPPRISDSRLFVKQEPLSPNVTDIDLDRYRPESLDLDDLGGVVDTPRKRNRMKRLRQTSRAFADSHQQLHTERSMSEPPMETQPFEQHLNRGVEAAGSDRGTGSRPDRMPLATVDGNRQRLPPVSTTIAQRKSPPSDHVENAPSLLSRKDKQFLQIVDENVNEDEPTEIASKIRRDTARLASMLKLSTPPDKKGSRRPSSSNQASVPTTNNPQKEHPQPNSKTKAAEKIRLRDRPLKQLNLGDFKHNIKFTHGHADVSSYQTRQCRPGCTDSRCCGEAMRTIAKSMPFLKLTRPPFAADPEDKQLSDDEYWIKWHLGAEAWSRDRVRRMENHEYEELLLTARTALLAQRYGRHKEEHEKRMTPPGYWQMSMPSTQELALQHDEAAEIEASLIRDRWTEAKKGNGRWRFIDE